VIHGIKYYVRFLIRIKIIIYFVSVNRAHSITANCPVTRYWFFLSLSICSSMCFLWTFQCLSLLLFFFPPVNFFLLFLFLLLLSHLSLPIISSLIIRTLQEIINLSLYDLVLISLHYISTYREYVYFIYVCALVPVADRDINTLFRP